MNEFIEYLKFIGIYDEMFLSFLEGKVHRFRVNDENMGWGVFPKLDSEGRIIDVRVFVPAIVNEKTLLINIHEYVHAYDWYQKLYEYDDISKDEELEIRARNAEKMVLEKIRKSK